MIIRHEAYDLSRQNTFGMRVSCRLYVEVTDPEDLLTLDFNALPQPLFVMGGGSNLLFTGDFPGTVLRMVNQGRSVMPGSTGHLSRAAVYSHHPHPLLAASRRGSIRVSDNLLSHSYLP